MSEEKDVKKYKKPELIHIDDPAFEETGQGYSGLGNPGSDNGNRGNDKDVGGGNNPPGPGGNGP